MGTETRERREKRWEIRESLGKNKTLRERQGNPEKGERGSESEQPGQSELGSGGWKESRSKEGPQAGRKERRGRDAEN